MPLLHYAPWLYCVMHRSVTTARCRKSWVMSIAVHSSLGHNSEYQRDPSLVAQTIIHELRLAFTFTHLPHCTKRLADFRGDLQVFSCLKDIRVECNSLSIKCVFLNQCVFIYKSESTNTTNTSIQLIKCWLKCHPSLSCVPRASIINTFGSLLHPLPWPTQWWRMKQLLAPSSLLPAPLGCSLPGCPQNMERKMFY